MVKRVFGKIDDVDVILQNTDGNRWQVPVPMDEDGEYIYGSCDYAAYGFQWYMISKFNNMRLDDSITTWVIASDGVSGVGSTAIHASQICGADYLDGTVTFNYPIELVENSHCTLNQSIMPTNGNGFTPLTNGSTLIISDKNGTKFNKYNGSTLIIQSDGQCEVGSGAALPTDGTWNKNNIFRIASETYGAQIVFVCTSGGTPGTWKASKYIPLKGSTFSRQGVSNVSEIGTMFFDTTLATAGKPVWWTGTAWVDSTGAVV